MENIFKVEIITRAEKLNVLKDALAQKGIKGMTVSNVMGAGTQKGKTLTPGSAGDGKILIIPLANVIRIRTGQTGEDAI